MDMAGNLSEWCTDWYSEDAYSSPKGAGAGIFRVVRGASWNNCAKVNFRCAGRNRYLPSYRSNFIGFRVAR